MSWVQVAPPAPGRGRTAVPRRWTVPARLHVEAVGDGQSLLLDTDTGAWVIVRRDGMPAIEVLLQAAREQRLQATDEVERALAPLIDAGIIGVAGAERRLPHRAPNEQATKLLILKLVGYCNLACSYCYDYDDARYKDRLTFEQASSAIVQALDAAPGDLTVLFHGGEPLLAFDLVRRLVDAARDAQEGTAKRLHFSIQTNGTVFRDEVVDFLIEHHFSVGLSLDGPPDVNDLLRVDHRGRGRHEEITDALARRPDLVERIGVLTTVTRHNAARLVEIARYVRDLGVKTWDVSPYQAAGRATSDARFAPSHDEVVASYVALLDEVEAGNFDDIEICPVLHYVRNVVTYSKANMCMRGGGCGAGRELVSIAADGTIEACDCIKVDGLALGNMATSTLREALGGAVAHSIRSRYEGLLEPCRSCTVRAFCGGTCLAMAGGLDAIDDLECRLALTMYPEIFRRLAAGDGLERYVERYP